MSLSVKQAFEMFLQSRIDPTLENAFFAGAVTTFMICMDAKNHVNQHTIKELNDELKAYMAEHPHRKDMQ